MTSRSTRSSARQPEARASPGAVAAAVRPLVVAEESDAPKVCRCGCTEGVMPRAGSCSKNHNRRAEFNFGSSKTCCACSQAATNVGGGNLGAAASVGSGCSSMSAFSSAKSTPVNFSAATTSGAPRRCPAWEKLSKNQQVRARCAVSPPPPRAAFGARNSRGSAVSTCAPIAAACPDAAAAARQVRRSAARAGGSGSGRAGGDVG